MGLRVGIEAVEEGGKQATMSEHENLRLMREFFEAANAHDVDRLAAMVEEAYVQESDSLPAPVRGREAYRQMLKTHYSAFPNLHYEIEQMIASGDYVVTRLRLSGTNQGEFGGNPATNRRVEFHLCHWDQFRNGKIIHAWGYSDTGTLLRQLGISQAGTGG